MTGKEFIRRVRRLARTRGVEFRFDKSRGKGSHGTLWFAGRHTIVKDRASEIGPGLLNKMLRDLGLTPGDLS